MFRRRLAAAIAALPIRPGQTLLDVGIGTGFSLSHYPAHLHVTGVDLSLPMLQRARRKIAKLRPGVSAGMTRLVHADAQQLPFPDGTFDLLFLSHVVSTVSDPHRCLAEALREALAHAPVMIVNHFRSESWVRRAMEMLIDPFCRKLGWRTDLSLRDLLAPFNVQGIPAGSPIFQTVLLQKSASGIRAVALDRAQGAVPVWRPALGRS